MSYKWKLASDSFTIWDRLKVAWFILNKSNQLTMGSKVLEFEKIMSEQSGKYALAVSSGSAANHLIFELYKQRNPRKFANSLVIVPAVTWISSISPILMAGYKIEFCDVNLIDFSFDYLQLEKILEKNKDKNLIIWPTALIGFCPNFTKLKILTQKYNAELWGDFCENQMSSFCGKSILSQVKISSLSMYFSHMITSVEMGWVFFTSQDDFEYGKMLRNHGLTRSLDKDSQTRLFYEHKYHNIDKQFLFGCLGTNWRTSDMHAIWGLQDIKRFYKYKKHRKDIYNYYYDKLDKNKYYLPDINRGISAGQENVAFCLPIFRKDDKINEVKKVLNNNRVATRPIIGGNLLIQHPFFHYKAAVPNAEWIHNHGAYVGLCNNLTFKNINKLTSILNSY